MKALCAVLGVLILALLAFAGVELLHLNFVFGLLIPYAAIAIFLVGIIFRVVQWARSPVPFNIPTVCGQQKSLPWIKSDKIESPTSTAGVIGRLALEVLLFRSLFRNEKVELKGSQKLVYGGNKYLWLGGLLFHWSMLIILIRHSRFFLEPVPSAVLFIQDIDGILQAPIMLLYITDILILIGLTYLFLRRVVWPQVRYISLAADYFAVLLILGVALSGILTKLFFRVDVESVKEMAVSALSFRPAVVDGIGVSFYVHLFLVSSLLAYFPFSKMVHFAGVLLSPTRNLKNNSRMKRHINPWNKPVKVHTYEEWEDEFRKAMKEVGLPVEKES
jgi:nitrate reductase gamma subunit